MTTPTDLREQAAAASAELRDHENEGVTSSDRFALRERSATLIDQLASALPVWRPISEAPKDGTRVLLRVPVSDDLPAVIGGWYEAGLPDRSWYDEYHNEINPDGWMPLPQSEPVPEEKEKA